MFVVVILAGLVDDLEQYVIAFDGRAPSPCAGLLSRRGDANVNHRARPRIAASARGHDTNCVTTVAHMRGAKLPEDR